MRIPAFFCPVDVFEGNPDDGVLSTNTALVQAAIATAMREDGVPETSIATFRVLGCEAEDRDSSAVEAEGDKACARWVRQNAETL